MARQLCALCRETDQLCDSHIIPEFFFTACYDDRHRLEVLSATAAHVTLLQKGYREPLLCLDCEGHLNESFEQDFKGAWYDQQRCPTVPRLTQTHIDGLDYAGFKLCLLSVLWRASAASGQIFKQASLGAEHGERLRQMLLHQDAGPYAKYPILADVLYLNDYVVDAAVIPPVRQRYRGYTIYNLGFGGCLWFFPVGTFTLEEILADSLKPSGVLPIGWRDFSKIPFVRSFVADHFRSGGKGPADRVRKGPGH